MAASDGPQTCASRSSSGTSVLTATIQTGVGERLDVQTVPTEAEAQTRLRELKISGAFVPGPKPTLLVASASSDSTTSAVEKIFTTVAAAQGAPLAVRDVVPLDETDPIGQNGFFSLVTLSVGSYATAIAIAAAGATRRFRERLGLLIGAAVLTASAQLAFASILFGMFPGHGAAVWGLSVLYSLTVMAIGVGLHVVVGRFSTLLFSAMFVALNFTSSGGVFQPAMQPGFFGWLNAFWIGSGFLRTLNHVLYFPDADATHGVSILIGWLLFGGGCLALAHYVDFRRRHLARLARTNESLRSLLDRARTDGLTPRQAMELELEEDVAV